MERFVFKRIRRNRKCNVVLGLLKELEGEGKGTNHIKELIKHLHKHPCLAQKRMRRLILWKCTVLYIAAKNEPFNHRRCCEINSRTLEKETNERKARDRRKPRSHPASTPAPNPKSDPPQGTYRYMLNAPGSTVMYPNTDFSGLSPCARQSPRRYRPRWS